MDDKRIREIASQTMRGQSGIDNSLEKEIELSIKQALAEERERIAGLIPDTWLDPLLTGGKAVIGNPPYNCGDIEKLLRAIVTRIEEHE